MKTIEKITDYIDTNIVDIKDNEFVCEEYKSGDYCYYADSNPIINEAANRVWHWLCRPLTNFSNNLLNRDLREVERMFYDED